ncbi:MAG: circularly permuted type 2 ATP-grasp protein [Magnetococcales bacterium]|nr:circularly permuted type 2 ATP-grasp protein [Magnetococcales bacterium]
MIVSPHALTTSSLSPFLEGYQLSSGWDELFAADGSVRPAWQEIITFLEQMGSRQLESCRIESQRLLRESGVTHNLYGGTKTPKLPWELDLLPYVITGPEWSLLERGLQQRIVLLGMILTDLTGPEKLFRDGLLPPELFFAHPAWHPTWHNLRASGAFPLTFCAVDLARRSDGGFAVLADYCDMPSGAGYVLENRMILTRVIPGLFKQLNIRRLLPFFASLRSNLEALAVNNPQDPHIVMMAGGLMKEANFEQVFLSNYLGLTLAQGDDMTVRNGRLAIKTLDGLRPVDVILRRVADIDCDSLELRGDCCQGVTGLMHALRRGTLGMANAPGTGMLENLGLIPYLPELCRALLGEDLLLPSIATWWCGDPVQRHHVIAHFNDMVIKPLRPMASEPVTVVSEVSHAVREQLLERIKRNPALYVGQLPFQPGTAPVLSAGRIEPKSVVVRSFITANRKEREVLPGGLARFSVQHAHSKEQYDVSKGVWILSDEPAPPTPRARDLHPIEAPLLVGELPSRVAENLFWIGRYAERAEYAIRIMRTILLLWHEESSLPEDQSQQCLKILLVTFARITGGAPAFLGEDAESRLADPEETLLAAILNADQPGSITSMLAALVRSTQMVRERFSLDTWQVIQQIIKGLEGMQTSRDYRLSEIRREIDLFITLLMAFSGQIMESMTQGQGWRFLNSGRRLERAIYTIGLVEGTMIKQIQTQHENAVLEFLLIITDSLITFRRRYRSRLEARPVLDLILLDETNPRSLAFQIQALDEHAAHLPRSRRMPSYRSPEGRITLDALSALRLADPQLISVTAREEGTHRPNLEELLLHINGLLSVYSATLSSSFFQHTQPRKQLAAIF